MNSLVRQLQRLGIGSREILLQSFQHPLRNLESLNGFHTTACLSASWNKHTKGPKKWLQYNKIVYPPQQPGEEPRKAFVCHMRTNIKYSPDKMWYIACMVRGLSVDEAIKQLSFVLKKGAKEAKEVIMEAQDLAVQRHNVEFRSNLWIAESFVGKGVVFKGYRRHARGRAGTVEYKHCHYFVRLEEGEPPKHYYLPAPLTPQQQFDEWLDQMHKRKVINSL